MKFPKRIKYRGKVLAVIYGKSKGRDSYRVAWHIAGQRRMASFASYSLAKNHADKLVKDLAKGSTVTALHPSQARDALAAFECLQSHYQTTGRRVSLLASVSAFCESDAKLSGQTLTDAVDGFLSNIAKVKRIDLKEAVEAFIKLRKTKTIAKEGKRPQLSEGWHYILERWLTEFKNTFPGYAVCDLTKEHLAQYLNAHSDVSARTRNGRRNAVKMFLKWCVENDYLSANHRLFNGDSMKKETQDIENIEIYTPKELRDMLDCASKKTEYKTLLPVIALGGLGGLRLQEIARLDWKDVWRVHGHVEISATKSKTRQRRLVEIVPALAAWLEDYRDVTGSVWTDTLDNFHDLFGAMRDELEIKARRNGLRHAFCSFHFALHANENLTAQQAGNSPSMIHGHYKGLATKAEAEKWFAVMPSRPSNVIQLSTEKSGQLK